MSGPSAPPLPFTQYVVKVHSRCDLACDHCYVYEAKDTSWHGRPAVMAAGTVDQLAERILDHAHSHRLGSVRIVLHGGEPLLAGHDRLEQYVATLRSRLVDIPRVDLRIHTNGVRLDEKFCELFSRHQVIVGISVDGDREANDRHRRFANGRSSYPFVERAVRLLCRDEYKHIYAGILCTIDVNNDPIAVYEALRSFAPPRVDFLLPHATWDNPPARGNAAIAGADPRTVYADWLIAIFERWNADGRPMGVRFFDSIESLARGGPSGTEALGTGPSDLVVVETDGSFEQVDSLKVVAEGASATGLDVFTHSLDAVAAHPGIAARRQGAAGLCDTCRACPVVAVCGGGLYPHRYRTGTGFDNPSVFCEDLKKLITHVTSAMPNRPDSRPLALRGEAAQGPLEAATLDELAAGRGGAAAVAALAKAQRELLGVLLVGLAERAEHLPAWELITRLDVEQPAALDAVLAHPFVRRWAQESLIALAAPSSRAKAAPHLGHLAGVAAAAAVRAGVEARVEVPLFEGALHLPTLGRLEVGASVSGHSLIVESHAGGFTVRHDDASHTVVIDNAAESDHRWQPVRRLRAESGTGVFSCALDDVDLYRDCFQWPAAPRQDEVDIKPWRKLFSEAWGLIQRDYPDYAPGILTGLTTLVPLSVPAAGDYSASSRDAFGAIGLALPHGADLLALLLIHEWQHVRMWAVYDLYDLFDPEDRRLYYAAWRPDPRPLSGLLQGTYAHVGVTDFWRIRRQAASDPQDRDEAAAQFARWRQMTAEAIDTMAGSGAMTPIGARFLDGMRTTLEPWLAEPVPAEALDRGLRMAERYRASWLHENSATARSER